MRFVPKISLRARLTAAMLLVIALSWVLGAGLSYLVMLQEVRTLRAQMLARPDLYPYPVPEPRFDLVDFIFGPQQILRRQGPPPGSRPWMRHQPTAPGQADRPPDGPERPVTPARPYAPVRRTVNWGIVVSRVGIAVVLALLAAAWITRRVTRPLAALTQGARAYQGGNLDHRVPVRGDDEFTQVASAMNDMAAQVSANVRELREDARRRRQLLADVAHELRSPVMTMRTMAGALAEGLTDDPERHKRAVQALVRTSDRMLHQVSDLLELAKLDLHELPLQPRPFDLRQLVAAHLQAHSDAAGAAGLDLAEAPQGTPVVVDADPDRLAQVVDNLLDNAISYAGSGATVTVTLEEEADAVRLVIADTGRGIPARHLPFLFDAFYRADATRTPGSTHSGLGLRIARGLVEAHGGTLTLESEEGKGTRAVVTLVKG